MPHARIEQDPDIMSGKPVVRGTRIPVETILRKPGAGMTHEAILRDHPRLTVADIHAAQAFAADYLADEDAGIRIAPVRWLADECVDAGLSQWLRAQGHDVVYIAETAAHATDAEVMAMAQTEGRLLLTEDKDFGELVFRHAWPVPGIVLLRIDPARHTLRVDRLRAAIDRLGAPLLGG